MGETQESKKSPKEEKDLKIKIKEMKSPKYKEKSFPISTIKQIEEGNAPAS